MNFANGILLLAPLALAALRHGDLRILRLHSRTGAVGICTSKLPMLYNYPLHAQNLMKTKRFLRNVRSMIFDEFWVTFRDMPDSPCRCLTSVGHGGMPDLRWNKAAYLLDLIGIPCQICQTVAEDSMIFYDHLCVICVLKKRLTEKLRLCASWKGSPLWSMQWAITLPSSKKLKHWASGTWTSKLPASWSKYVQTCPNITKHIKDIKALVAIEIMALRPWQVSSDLLGFLCPFSTTSFQGIRAGFFREALMDTIDDQLGGQVSMPARAGLHCLLNYAGSINKVRSALFLRFAWFNHRPDLVLEVQGNTVSAKNYKDKYHEQGLLHTTMFLVTLICLIGCPCFVSLGSPFFYCCSQCCY